MITKSLFLSIVVTFFFQFEGQTQSLNNCFKLRIKNNSDIYCQIFVPSCGKDYYNYKIKNDTLLCFFYKFIQQDTTYTRNGLMITYVDSSLVTLPPKKKYHIFICPNRLTMLDDINVVVIIYYRKMMLFQKKKKKEYSFVEFLDGDVSFYDDSPHAGAH